MSHDLSRCLTADGVRLLKRYGLLAPLLRAVVSEELLVDVRIQPEQLAELLRTWQGEANLATALEQAQRSTGMGRDDVEWFLQQPAKMEIMARENFSAKAEVRFLSRKDDLDQVIYSLIRTKDASLSREIYLRLVAGEASFAELAQRFSEGPERQNHGQVGPNPLTAAHPLLAERLRTARDGEVMEPFELAGWWLILRRDQLHAAVFDQAMAERMAQETLREWIQQEAERRLAVMLAGEADT